jgi:hypothetical protein
MTSPGGDDNVVGARHKSLFGRPVAPLTPSPPWRKRIGPANEEDPRRGSRGNYRKLPYQNAVTNEFPIVRSKREGAVTQEESELLNTPEVDRLMTLVEEATRATKGPPKRFIEPARGTLDRAKSRRHHIVFGRRGSGKTSLLRKAGSDLTLQRIPAAHLDSPPAFGEAVVVDAARRAHRNPDIPSWGLILECDGGKENKKLWDWYVDQGFTAPSPRRPDKNRPGPYRCERLKSAGKLGTSSVTGRSTSNHLARH